MRRLAGTVTPQGPVAVCRFVDIPLDALDPGARTHRRPGRGPRSGERRHHPPHRPRGRVRRVIVSARSVDVYNEKAVRASAGALFHVPVAREVDPGAAVDVPPAAGRDPAGGRGRRRARPVRRPVARRSPDRGRPVRQRGARARRRGPRAIGPGRPHPDARGRRVAEPGRRRGRDPVRGGAPAAGSRWGPRASRRGSLRDAGSTRVVAAWTGAERGARSGDGP